VKAAVTINLAGGAASTNLVPVARGSPATVAWPTPHGRETRILTPGTPLTLSGISGS